MSARILDGKRVADAARDQAAREAAVFRDRAGIPPGLAVVLVGDNPASHVYVRNKRKACRSAGIDSLLHECPADITESALLDLIDRLNEDPAIHGILVQLPLPPHIRESRVVERVRAEKDVDGFHPENAGLLATGRPRFVPCTPLGIQALLEAETITTQGLHAVVIGRSNIVGKPMALLLLQRGAHADATVTVVHTATRDPAAVARRADLLIVAAGRPEMVRAEWIKPGAIVVDVGIHRRADGSLCGDVHFESAREVAAAITPVPGGVGPMTIAMLLRNTLKAARLQSAHFSSETAP